MVSQRKKTAKDPRRSPSPPSGQAPQSSQHAPQPTPPSLSSHNSHPHLNHLNVPLRTGSQLLQPPSQLSHGSNAGVTQAITASYTHFSSFPANPPVLPQPYEQGLTGATPAPVASSSSLGVSGVPGAPTPPSNQASGSSPGKQQPRKKSSSRSHQKKQKDSNHVPRPPNCFMLFRQHYSKALNTGGGESNQQMVSGTAAEQWHGMPTDAKQYWKDKAKDAADEHKRIHPNYRYQPKRPQKKNSEAEVPETQADEVPAAQQCAMSSPSPAVSSGPSDLGFETSGASLGAHSSVSPISTFPTSSPYTGGNGSNAVATPFNDGSFSQVAPPSNHDEILPAPTLDQQLPPSGFLPLQLPVITEEPSQLAQQTHEPFATNTQFPANLSLAEMQDIMNSTLHTGLLNDDFSFATTPGVQNTQSWRSEASASVAELTASYGADHGHNENLITPPPFGSQAVDGNYTLGQISQNQESNSLLGAVYGAFGAASDAQSNLSVDGVPNNLNGFLQETHAHLRDLKDEDFNEDTPSSMAGPYFSGLSQGPPMTQQAQSFSPSIQSPLAPSTSSDFSTLSGDALVPTQWSSGSPYTVNQGQQWAGNSLHDNQDAAMHYHYTIGSDTNPQYGSYGGGASNATPRSFQSLPELQSNNTGMPLIFPQTTGSAHSNIPNNEFEGEEQYSHFEYSHYSSA